MRTEKKAPKLKQTNIETNTMGVLTQKSFNRSIVIEQEKLSGCTGQCKKLFWFKTKVEISARNIPECIIQKK